MLYYIYIHCSIGSRVSSYRHPACSIPKSQFKSAFWYKSFQSFFMLVICKPTGAELINDHLNIEIINCLLYILANLSILRLMNNNIYLLYSSTHRSISFIQIYFHVMTIILFYQTVPTLYTI